MAADHVNENPSIMPGYHLRVLMESDGRSVSGSIEGTIRLLERGVVAIIGPSRSIYAQAVQYYVGGRLVPCVSPSATADSLSDKSFYPSFLRTVQFVLYCAQQSTQTL